MPRVNLTNEQSNISQIDRDVKTITAGMTQTEIAEAAGITQGRVSQIMKRHGGCGWKKQTVEQLVAIAQTTGREVRLCVKE